MTCKNERDLYLTKVTEKGQRYGVKCRHPLLKASLYVLKIDNSKH